MSDEKPYVCPCCFKPVPKEHFSCAAGKKGGRSGTGACKSRGSENARKAAMARWGKREAVVTELQKEVEGIIVGVGV